MLLCLQVAKLEQLVCKRFFVGAFANTYYSMLGSKAYKNVVGKITIYATFVQKLLWNFFVKRKKFAQAGNLLFDRNQLLLASKVCKMILSTVITMWISSFENSHAFNQSDINISDPIIRYGTMVWQLKALIGSLGHYDHLP